MCSVADVVDDYSDIPQSACDAKLSIDSLHCVSIDKLYSFILYGHTKIYLEVIQLICY